ncbi:signal peptidase I [Salinirarus marinus]
MSENDRTTLRFLANVLGVLVLLAAVSPFVVYAVPQVVGADQGLVVLSGSMEPKMSPGDAVIVRDVPASEIERNDVVTFKRAGSETPTTHRVVEIRQTGGTEVYVTKGDANEGADPGTVSYDRVIGEVIFVIPFIGHLIQFANTQLGFLALVLTPMALFVLSELWELVKSIRGPSSTETSASSDAPSDATTPAASNDAADVADGETDADGGSLTLTRSSLQLLLLLLGLYVPYSGYVAYTTREAWSIGAATATAVAFLFCLVIYVASLGSGGDSPASTERTPDGIVRQGELPARLDERTTVPLASVESLIETAVDRDDWVVYDDERETYYLTQDDVLYLHRAAPEPDGGTTVSAAGEPDETTPTGGGNA